jgi:hypothetical protein
VGQAIEPILQLSDIDSVASQSWLFTSDPPSRRLRQPWGDGTRFIDVQCATAELGAIQGSDASSALQHSSSPRTQIPAALSSEQSNGPEYHRRVAYEGADFR